MFMPPEGSVNHLLRAGEIGELQESFRVAVWRQTDRACPQM
jgi:hypothetical protein